MTMTDIFVPRQRPIISEDAARRSAKVIHEIAQAEMEGDPPWLNIRRQAAKDLLTLYQTQERLAAERAAQPAKPSKPNGAQSRKLAGFTPEQVADLEAQLTADYPGKPA